MNNSNLFVLLMVLSCLVGSTAMRAQSGGPYTLDQSVTAGGGGGSSGGSFALQGTIGQGVVGAMSAGNYTQAGGFWPAFCLCIVNLEDFAYLADDWLLTGTGLAADLNKDGAVDLNDLAILASYWLSPCSIQWPLQ
jgi:hypothetical protein